MTDKKQKFMPLFLEFATVLALDIPRVFFTSYPLYRAMSRRLSKRKIDNGIKNLYYRGYIVERENGYGLTEKGQHWLTSSRFKVFRLLNKSWDKKWRIIMFDIPSELSKTRHSLRYFLKSIGAYMIQKSIFVFPYPCERELGEQCQNLGISDCVDVIVSDHIGSKEPYVLKHFEL